MERNVKFQHRFLVNAPIEKVAEFHSRSSSMAAVTPPPISVQIHQAPPFLSEGDEMKFTLWAGPMPIRWHARMENISANGFDDRQVHGPFSEWVHRHRYHAVNEQTTEVVDDITLRLSSKPLWWVIGLGMRISLPILFAFRAWKTQRLLQ